MSVQVSDFRLKSNQGITKRNSQIGVKVIATALKHWVPGGMYINQSQEGLPPMII